MSIEKRQPEGAPKKKLRFLSREEKERLVQRMLGKGHSQNGVAPDKGDNPAESQVDAKPSGGTRFETPQWVYDMAEKYGEPTMSREELSEELSKELGGKSLSDLVIEERRKKPY